MLGPEPMIAAAARRADTWLLAPAPAERLAALRILVGGFVVIYIAATVGEFARLANRAGAEFEPIGLAKIVAKPLSAGFVWALFAGLIIFGVAFALGLRFRISGPVFALLTLFWASYHSSWGQLLHFEHVFTLHLLILGVSPAAATWSLDSRRAEGVSPDPAVRFGWPIHLMAIVTAITYVIAGIAKLRISGVTWIDGTTLRNHIAYSATRMDLLGGFEPPLASFVVSRSWLIAPLAIGAVAIELAAPIALLGRRWRTGWVVCVLAMHLGTAATMMVWFPYQGLGFALLPLFHVESLRGFMMRFNPT